MESMEKIHLEPEPGVDFSPEERQTIEEADFTSIELVVDPHTPNISWSRTAAPGHRG